MSKKLHALTGVKHKVTSLYHPQSNGFVERMNKTLKKILIKSCIDKSKGDWAQSLPGALYSIRISKQTSTKVTPFEALFHRKVEMPLLLADDYDLDQDADVDESVFVPRTSEIDEGLFDEATSYFRRMEEIRRVLIKVVIHPNIKSAQKKQKMYYDDRSTAGKSFNIDDRVLIRDEKPQQKRFKI